MRVVPLVARAARAPLRAVRLAELVPVLELTQVPGRSQERVAQRLVRPVRVAREPGREKLLAQTRKRPLTRGRQRTRKKEIFSSS